MTCSLCKEADVVSFDYGPLCKECFVRNVERRVRKQLNSCLVAGQRVRIVDNGFGGVVRFFLDRTGLPLTVVFEGEADVVMDCLTSDDEGSAYLEAVVTGKKVGKKGCVQPLLSLMRDEVIALGEVIGIPLKDCKKSFFETSFDTLTKKDGAVRFGVLASRQKLEYD